MGGRLKIDRLFYARNPVILNDIVKISACRIRHDAKVIKNPWGQTIRTPAHFCALIKLAEKK